ncbi:MAG: hypothetical protein HeimC2_32180 [Candidatus Heimdallarchaeota archaeon LC_2]|nr:MAG: hypothetical protein HeimC2_32180 [Candidatus Heimdallarchaeota archaeon LC_2]
MIRKSLSKSKSSSNKKKKLHKRTSKKNQKSYTCNLHPVKERYSSTSAKDFEKHLSKAHSRKRGKGVDLTMFFEVLRVIGVISIVGFLGAIAYNSTDMVANETEAGKTIKQDNPLINGDIE